MVDLAGSERVKKSKAQGKRMAEAKHINKSLSTLERVIVKLSEVATGQITKKVCVLVCMHVYACMCMYACLRACVRVRICV